MKKLIFATLLMVGFDAYAGFESSILMEFGQGEFANTHQTKKQIVTSTIDLGRYHVASKSINSNSESGAIDDNKYSLIDGNEVFIGAGIHRGNFDKGRNSGTLYLNDETYLIELESQRRIWGKVGVMAGLHHRNLYKKGRKTTSAKVGLYYQPVDKYQLSLSWRVGNNTETKTDDELLFGFRRDF